MSTSLCELVTPEKPRSPESCAGWREIPQRVMARSSAGDYISCRLRQEGAWVAADMRRTTGTAAATSTTDAGMLYERYSGRILAYCLHALRDRGEAEDAVQTTFLQAHRALTRGTTPEHEFAWLHTIAKNVCRVQKRTAARRAVVTGVDLDTFPAAGGGADETERLRGLGDALARCPSAAPGAAHARVAWPVVRGGGLTNGDERTCDLRAAHAGPTVACGCADDGQGALGLGLNVWPLFVRLKGVFAGSTAKVATTAAAAVAVAASGVAIEAGLVDRSNRRASSSRVPRGATGHASLCPCRWDLGRGDVRRPESRSRPGRRAHARQRRWSSSVAGGSARRYGRADPGAAGDRARRAAARDGRRT